MSDNSWRSKCSKGFQNIINQGRRVKIFERLRNGSSLADGDGWVGGYSRTPSMNTTAGDRDYTTQSTCSTSTSLDSAFNSTITSRSITKAPIALQNMPTNYQKKNNNNNNDQDYTEEHFNHPLLNANEPSPDEISNVFPSIPLSPSSVDSSPCLGVRKHNFTIIPMKHCPNERLELKISKRQGNEALGLILSALYGKLLVVMGIAFPMSEVISTYIPPSFYDGFYLYLYFGSIMFMICVYGNVLRHKATRSVRTTFQRINSMRLRQSNRDGIVAPDVTVDKISCESNSSESPIPSPILRPNVLNLNNHFETINGSAHSDSSSVVYGHERIHYGSFYLRMGAVAFGVGSMIYSGLEFGQYFELEPDTKCHNFMIALTPAVRMIFTFMQMYFIFLNSKLAESKVKLGAQFGLMHMIGTNMCVWLSVLVQETRHEILHFYNPDNHTITLPKFGWGSNFEGFGLSVGNETATDTIKLNVNDSSSFDDVFSTVATAILSHDIENNSHRVKRGLKGPHSIYECRRTDIIGSLVQNASPFLFPCTIEYSLICAAILYVMWKNMAKQRAERHLSTNIQNHNGDINMNKRSPHYYSVDCSRANKGLFFGILILVMTIISLILFFVFINRPGNQYKKLAVVAVNITEIILYSISTIAVLIGLYQIRELKYSHSRNLELDNILLVVAQTGSFIYNVFTIIGGHFTMKKNTVLVLFTGLASLVQLLFQTIFILLASNRYASSPEQARRKPGREIVTFLLVTNLAMWSINTLEKSRADSHPVQLNFYGVWAWTIITHISMPLAIFYRFHSTVCLCEIWKKAYKVKSPS